MAQTFLWFSAQPLGAKLAMQAFAKECVSELINRELQQSAPIFLSDPEDTSEEKLLGTSFCLLKEPVRESNETLWTLLQKAAYTTKQKRRNKDPDMSHFVSATAWTVWVLPKHVTLPHDINCQYQEHFHAHSNTLFDLEPIIFGELEKDDQIFNQNIDIVLHILLDSPKFAEYSEKHKNDPAFTPLSLVFQLDTGPDGIVEGYIGPTLDQEEASYDGTLKVIMFILCLLYLQSIKEQQTTGLQRFIVWLGDQLTADCLHGLWCQRHKDHNSFDHLDWMVPLFSNSAIIGSLKHTFNVLKCKGLTSTATKGPFWHHLDEAIYHVSEAHFLASWLAVAKLSKLSDLTTLSPIQLCRLAVKLINEHASATAIHNLTKHHLKDRQDPQLVQWIMWNKAVLLYLDLCTTVWKGDVGQMENLLPTLLF
ncbi:hypothetical protein BDP27DRAFT_1413005 [Rhodocollybia butyracea]|uniref:DUF6589 domain-containing protein n=1 Tax=Rhodocollybia butyracea TaxID=206335 RepID=A0A9P5UGX9_9AGAR|nr:hypothetical protein BDP27DRAFT_1413005 [Rhodocollybia butyracea]